MTDGGENYVEASAVTVHTVTAIVQLYSHVGNAMQGGDISHYILLWYALAYICGA